MHINKISLPGRFISLKKDKDFDNSIKLAYMSITTQATQSLTRCGNVIAKKNKNNLFDKAYSSYSKFTPLQKTTGLLLVVKGKIKPIDRKSVV